MPPATPTSEGAVKTGSSTEAAFEPLLLRRWERSPEDATRPPRGNGGLHQYFFNFRDPDHLAAVLQGYSRLPLEEARRVVEEVVAPIASEEVAWREALRDGSIETFFGSYVESRLPEYDDRIEFHDNERIELVRAHPAKFAR